MMVSRLSDQAQLTYCSNIHPGNGWAEVEANLQRYVPVIRQQVAPGVPFGLGLRLSDDESRQLLAGDQLIRFVSWLTDHDCYVFTLNGFPYGPFHRQPVKAQVYAPDWRDPARVAYTLRLVDILAHLLPAGIEGSISTVPLSYKAWVTPGDKAAMEGMVAHLVQMVDALATLQARDGICIHLDLEPEPDCLLETTAEVVDFFEHWLLPLGIPLLMAKQQTTREAAEGLLYEHIRLCYDTCHQAVEYEDPAVALTHLQQAGIRIGKVQLSAALRVPESADPHMRQQLAAFVEPVYLHQTIARQAGGTLMHYPDLDVALQAAPRDDQEWRIHFHVPLFWEGNADLASTRDQILALLQKGSDCSHFEIETYTWSVLPPALRQDLVTSITAEYQWVLEQCATQETPCRVPLS
ncbi:MAG: metabolite traffic protein EboE [Armatimonadota bacterium]